MRGNGYGLNLYLLRSNRGLASELFAQAAMKYIAPSRVEVFDVMVYAAWLAFAVSGSTVSRVVAGFERQAG